MNSALVILGVMAMLIPSAWASPSILDVPSISATPSDDVMVHGPDMALNSQLMWLIIPASDANIPHRVVVWCTEDVILHDMVLHVPGNDISVMSDSIRLNGMAQKHAGYSDADLFRVNIVDMINGARAVVMPGYGSLMVPVMMQNDSPQTMVVIQAVYASEKSDICHMDYFESPTIGLMFSVETATFGGFSSTMYESTILGINDFNAHLNGTGVDWHLGIDVHDLDREELQDIVPATEQDGIRAYLGPPDLGSLVWLSEHRPDIMAISCCGTSATLSQEDRIFRTAPSDTTLAERLAQLMIHNGMDVLLPVWKDDPWNNAYKDDAAAHFTKLGGTVDDGVVAKSNESLASKAEQIRDRIDMLVGEHGADSVAVFALPSNDIAFLKAMAEQEGADRVRWFGTDFIARNTEYVQNDVIEPFVSATGYTALQVAASGLHVDDVRASLTEATGNAATHDMLAAYESAWIMGLAIQHTQSTDPARLTEAIPDVSQTYYGTLGPMILDRNGDLIVTAFEVWSIHDGQWMQAGIIR